MKFNCSQYFNKNPESELCLENIQLLRKVPCMGSFAESIPDTGADTLPAWSEFLVDCSMPAGLNLWGCDSFGDGVTDTLHMRCLHYNS